MKKTFTIASGNVRILTLDSSAARTSIAVSPVGATYTTSFTLAANPNSPAAIWNGITDMQAATTLQNKELGAISGLKIEVVGGTSIDVEILQS